MRALASRLRPRRVRPRDRRLIFRARWTCASSQGVPAAASAAHARRSLVTLTFLAAFGVGLAYASWALVCRAGRCPSVERARRATRRARRRSCTPPTAGSSPSSGSSGARSSSSTTSRRSCATRSSSTEDKRFYSHAGVDWVRVPGARRCANIRGGGLARGLLDDHDAARAQHLSRAASSREKTPVRKLKEVKVARAIEARYSKDKILELYLNQIYLGNGAYGIETAAQRYFGKSVARPEPRRGGDARRAAQGAGALQPAPLPERAIQRRNTVIELMRREGVDQRRRREPREGVSAAARAPHRDRRRRAVLRRVGAPAARAAVRPAGSTSRGSRSTRRSTSTCRPPPSARSRASSARSRPAASARIAHATYEQHMRAGRASDGERDGAELAVPAGRVRRASIRAPAPCARSSAAATSTTPSSTARRRRCGSPARRSSRSSTRRPCRTAGRRLRHRRTTRRSSVPHGRRRRRGRRRTTT